MRNSMHRKAGRRLMLWIGFLLSVICLSGMPALADANVIVDDQASLLTDAEASSLRTRAWDLANEESLNVMLVTTDDAGGRSSQKYADWYYLDHCSGDDGVVFLIDMDNREIYLSTSGKMLYYITDRRVDDCLDRAYRYVSSGDYAGCFETMLERTAYYVRSGTGADVIRDEETGEILWSAGGEHSRGLTPFKILLSAVLGAVVSAAAAIGVIGKYRMKFGQYKYNFNLHNRLQLDRKDDSFVRKQVTRRRIPKNNGSSGGGFTSTHSTGGHSFGGGGRKF